MRIAVFGSGMVGGALGRRFGAQGHQVTYGVRNPSADKVKAVVATTLGEARATSVAEAARTAEIVVLATPWAETENAIRGAGDLTGKIVIDCTNPNKPTTPHLLLGHTTSGAEQVAAWATGANVYKAFNCCSFYTMADPAYAEGKPAMFVAGADGSNKTTVMTLVADLGFAAADAGDLTASRFLEPMAMLWVNLAIREGHGA
ncbi:MAG: NADPH-dependent F420 reductase, partial [Alphaproteobacteria bacterium]|nr:NADPH-dependent F420 reductase [Alphaproteobacteria bacterium]